MVKDLKMALRSTLAEILRAHSDFDGMPMVALIRMAKDRCREIGLPVAERELEDVIERWLESWEIDKVVSYVLPKQEKELGLPLGLPAWHIKLLAPDERSVYQTMNETDRAVIRLLRNQNNPEQLGQISLEEGRRLLAEQGVSLGDFPPDIEGKVRSYMDLSDTGWEWWFGLIDEGEKVPPLDDSDTED